MFHTRAEIAFDLRYDARNVVRVEYKGLVFDEPLRFDLLVDNCLLVELKAVEVLHPSSKAQLKKKKKKKKKNFFFLFKQSPVSVT